MAPDGTSSQRQALATLHKRKEPLVLTK